MRQPRPRSAPSAPGRGAPRGAGAAAAGALAAPVVALLAVVAALVAVVGGATPASATPSCSGPLADGQIRVVVVVDPGETGPRAPSATCLVVQAGTAGSKILAQRAAQLGLPAPRYAGSGLLCGLDGFPETACPVNNGGSFAYWAYFNASGGSWTYGHDNPFVRRMADGEIMGWRYTSGSPDGGAPQPRISPSASLFPPLAPPPTAPPAPPAGGGSAGGPGPGGSGGVPDLSGLTTTAPGPGPASAGAEATSVEAAAEGTTSSSADLDGSVGTDASRGDGADGAEELAAQAAGSSGSDGVRWLGPAVAIAAAGALVVGAVTRGRRRSRAGS